MQSDKFEGLTMGQVALLEQRRTNWIKNKLALCRLTGEPVNWREIPHADDPSNLIYIGECENRFSALHDPYAIEL
jgi:hypothetical protein